MQKRQRPNLLPHPVGSGRGSANGFMPRGACVTFMLALTVGQPLLLLFVPSINLAQPKAGINLPNKAYWLAPPR